MATCLDKSDPRRLYRPKNFDARILASVKPFGKRPSEQVSEGVRALGSELVNASPSFVGDQETTPAYLCHEEILADEYQVGHHYGHWTEQGLEALWQLRSA